MENANINKVEIIKNIYFYLVSLIGLILIVISIGQLVSLGLKTWVFTSADGDRYMSRPPAIYLEQSYELKTAENLIECSEKCSLTNEQKTALDNWTKDYKYWQENEKDQSKYIKANRQRDAVRGISMLIVGIPLFWLHWRIIRKKNKRN